ncbi:MAG TPA: ABC transporter ATP-binding protein [Candidatus Acidoferrales bacterium]|nr:ABC transporter ATP-binding protein [Candidatus Acidoferrales bacterium]
MASSIIVQGISKVYKLGQANRDNMLREHLAALFRNPFRRREPASQETIWALRDVSFSINKGEVVGIVGRNGAGKSTLLKILSNITYPTSGRVHVHGRVASLLEVGTGFHEELTGRENVYLNGSILGMKKREVEAKLDAIVDFAGVERFIDTPIKRYSSGMRLRLGFAVAAHLDPDVLIVDEVLAVGDAGFQKKCLSVMEDLRKGGRTVLFVSHNMAAVENLCSRGIWIDGGRVRQDGPTHEVIEAYLSTFASSDQTSADLTGVNARHGSGQIRYTGVAFLDLNGQPQPLTRCGDPLKIRFFYRATETIPYPSFGFRLTTELGTLVTDTSTWHHGIDIPEIQPGDGYIDLDIDSLNLLPGRFFFSLWITGLSQHVYDGVEHCASIEIELANIYRSGKNIDSRSGIVYFPQRWVFSGLATEQVSLAEPVPIGKESSGGHRTNL